MVCSVVYTVAIVSMHPVEINEEIYYMRILVPEFQLNTLSREGIAIYVDQREIMRIVRATSLSKNLVFIA